MENEKLDDLKVWTSHMRRTIQTSEHISCARLEHWKALDELDAVSCSSFIKILLRFLSLTHR